MLGTEHEVGRGARHHKFALFDLSPHEMKSDLNRTRRRRWSQQSPEDIWLEQGAYNSMVTLFFREVEAMGTN